MTVQHTPSGAMNIAPFVESIDLKPAHRKILDATSAKLADLLAKSPPDINDIGGTREKAAAGEIGPDLDPAAIDRLRLACALSGEAAGRFRRRMKIVLDGLTRNITSNPDLVEVATAAIDQVADRVRAAAEEHRSTVAKSPFAGSIDDHGAQSKINETLRWLSELRGQCVRDGKSWEILESLDIAKPPAEVLIEREAKS